MGHIASQIVIIQQLRSDKNMSYNYSGEEIIQIAIGEEEDAITFYKAAMEMEQPSHVKDVFHFLLHEEEKHLNILEKEILPLFKQTDFQWENEHEISSYLCATGKSEIFTSGVKGEDFVKANQDPKKVIEFAIGLEKKAIEFYKKVEIASSGTGKEAIKRIVEEEATHIHKLNELRKKLV